jgi:hypothetical protein
MDKLNEAIRNVEAGLTIYENEINLIIENQASVPESVLVKLGLVPATAVVEEAVKEPVIEATEVEEAPKKKGSRKSI